ncbi:MAG: arginine N-succinyltransferase, partial [Pseudomonadota bacterium]
MTFLIRPAATADIDAIFAFTQSAGSGMTTLPRSKQAIERRIDASLGAFEGRGPAQSRDIFFFILEDDEGPVGMASIFPNLGEDRPFYSYRVSHIA